MNKSCLITFCLLLISFISLGSFETPIFEANFDILSITSEDKSSFDDLLTSIQDGAKNQDGAAVKSETKEEPNRFLGMEFFNFEDLLKLIFRFAINLGVVVIIVRLIYYPTARRKDFLFTYLLISMSIFLLCFMLENVKLDLAFALGLFAIFGIIRYRTDTIPIKEMTYLFIVITVSVMNALVNKKITYVELLFANFALMAISFGLEKVWLLRHESYKVVTYEKIELIQAGKQAELQADLEQRTGLKINRVELGRIDFLRDTAVVRIYFYEDDQFKHYEERNA